MLLKITEFNRQYERVEVISNTDSGLFAVQYGPDSRLLPPTLEPDTSWHYDKGKVYYTVAIQKPTQREVLRTMIVSRTSANHYEIAYADALGCVYESAKSLSAVHEILEPLWQRKLQP